MDKDFISGFIRIHILYHASREPVYGLWIIEELARHGYRLSPGTIYPMLHSMGKKGYLQCRPEVIGGKVRKYYTITARGRKMLEEAMEKLRELVGEVL
ncbi:MAG: PadR family transcriptional regulator [Thermovirgaceae bacterium]